jgi:hypothetical protein
MSKKFLIIGLLFLSAGLAVMGWIIVSEQKQQQQREFYKNKYETEADQYIAAYYKWLELPEDERDDVPLQFGGNRKDKSTTQLRIEQQERLTADIDKLATSGLKERQLANILYGENWQDEVTKYKSRKKAEHSILAGSIIVTSFGGVVTFSWIIVSSSRMLIKLRKRRKSKASQNEQEASDAPFDETSQTTDQPDDKSQDPKKSLNVLLNCPTYNDEPVEEQDEEQDEEVEEQVESSRVAEHKSSIERLYMDEDSVKQAEEERAQVSHLSLAEAIRKRMLGSKARQVKIKPGTLDDSFHGMLEKLTEEVAAIRKYAAEQQDRVEKLQDGYDWNIIKNFCLRIIRCIDNLDSRIKKLTAQGINVGILEEIRDELVFALESSGIEQFAPETNIDYKGQERSAEAVKERVQIGDVRLSGKIAKVIRCGYRYSVDEENFKVVRAARVKLYA